MPSGIITERDVYTRRKMLEALKITPPLNTFFTSKFFNRKFMNEQKILTYDVKKGKRDIGRFANPLSSGYKLEKDGFITKETRHLYIKMWKEFTPDDTRSRPFGSNPYEEVSSADIATQLENECFAHLYETSERLIEKVCVEAVTTGKIVAQGIGINDVLEFGYTAGNGVNDNIKTLSGSSCWDHSTPTGNIIDYLEELQQNHLQRCGRIADLIIMSPDAYKYFKAHPSIRDYMDKRYLNLGDINPQWQGNGIGHVGRFPLISGNVDIITYTDWYLDPDTEQEKPIFPKGKILLCSSGAECEMHYGLIQNLHNLRAVPYFPMAWTETDGSRRYMQLESAPMPIIKDVDSFTVVNVLTTAV